MLGVFKDRTGQRYVGVLSVSALCLSICGMFCVCPVSTSPSVPSFLTSKHSSNVLSNKANDYHIDALLASISARLGICNCCPCRGNRKGNYICLYKEIVSLSVLRNSDDPAVCAVCVCVCAQISRCVYVFVYIIEPFSMQSALALISYLY